jgi:hypothetical protein
MCKLEYDKRGQIFDEVEGVRILVFSDSCHSGTVVKAAYITRMKWISPRDQYRYEWNKVSIHASEHGS